MKIPKDFLWELKKETEIELLENLPEQLKELEARVSELEDFIENATESTR